MMSQSSLKTQFPATFYVLYNAKLHYMTFMVKLTFLVTGIPIDKVALLSQEIRNYVGKKLLELTMMELFIFHFMQASSTVDLSIYFLHCCGFVKYIFFFFLALLSSLSSFPRILPSTHLAKPWKWHAIYLKRTCIIRLEIKTRLSW